jgi:hypothetical protein
LRKLRLDRSQACSEPVWDFGLVSFVDFLAIAPIFRQKLHDGMVDITVDHEKALVRLFEPIPTTD